MKGYETKTYIARHTTFETLEVAPVVDGQPTADRLLVIAGLCTVEKPIFELLFSEAQVDVPSPRIPVATVPKGAIRVGTVTMRMDSPTTDEFLKGTPVDGGALQADESVTLVVQEDSASAFADAHFAEVPDQAAEIPANPAKASPDLTPAARPTVTKARRSKLHGWILDRLRKGPVEGRLLLDELRKAGHVVAAYNEVTVACTELKESGAIVCASDPNDGLIRKYFIALEPTASEGV